MLNDPFKQRGLDGSVLHPQWQVVQRGMWSRTVMGSSRQLLPESWPFQSFSLQLVLSVRFTASVSTLISPALPSVYRKICNEFSVSLSRGNRAGNPDRAEVEPTRRELHHRSCKASPQPLQESRNWMWLSECPTLTQWRLIKFSLLTKLTDQFDDCMTRRHF